MRRYFCLFGLCVSSLSFAAADPSRAAAKDLYLGEAFYYAFQGEYVDAITRLDTELVQFNRLDDPNLDRCTFRLIMRIFRWAILSCPTACTSARSRDQVWCSKAMLSSLYAMRRPIAWHAFTCKKDDPQNALKNHRKNQWQDP